MSDSYDGGEDVETNETDDGNDIVDLDGFEVSAYETDEIDSEKGTTVALSETGSLGKGGEKAGFDSSAYVEKDTNVKVGVKTAEMKDESSVEVDYSRPTHWRAGMREEVWERAKDEHGRVRDPVTGRYMAKDQPWEMGHKPGLEFKKHQMDAQKRGISRQEFLDEYYNINHFRPELPSSNRSHKGEDSTDRYFG